MIPRVAVLLAFWSVAVVAEGGPRKVTQADAMAAVVTKVQPEYPELARQLKITGTVELEVVIAESGAVDAVTPVSGNPVLTKPAAESLKKWKFKPFVQDGSPVKAQVVIKIGFSR
jgi:periplasmic protein TonB